MTAIEFTSIVGPSHKEELERLLFFNQNQDKALADLPLLIQRYGMARVIVSNDRLRVVLDSSPEPQTLFALEESGGAASWTDDSIPQSLTHPTQLATTKKSGELASRTDDSIPQSLAHPTQLATTKKSGGAASWSDDSIPRSLAHPTQLATTKKSNGPGRLVGVMVYLREDDTLSLIIAAVREDYAGERSDREEPLARGMVDVLREIARRVKGIASVTVFPGTSRERQLSVT